jgi:hypothetical protein
MGKSSKNCIVASKAAGEKEKKVTVNKVRVALAPPKKSQGNESQGRVSEQHNPQAC